MRKLILKVDLEASTKKEMIDLLQQLIWEVKTTDTRFGQTVKRGTWRLLTDLERAELARDYVALCETALSPNQALADSRGWMKSYAIDCVVRLRGHGYLTPATEAPALTEKAKKELLLAEHANRD